MRIGRKGLWLLCGWVGLLVLSTGYRFFVGIEPDLETGQEAVVLQVDPSVAESKQVRLAYRLQNASANEAPLLLLHGNPMAGRAMLPLAASLGTDRPILIPDLPGLGTSERNVTAFSAENQASVLLAWLDGLGVELFHVAGYSQGSAVALELASRVPDQVLSVALIAGVGLQEHELLGNYEWNQPLYVAYEAALWSLRWLTPHFGFLDRPVLASTTARNFADTDLRRNRAFLENLTMPTLIAHSETDRMVPYAAAKAHAEIVEQARFFELPGGHLGVFSHTQVYGDALNDFIQAVEAGERVAPDRYRAAALQVELPSKPSWIQDALIVGLLFVLVFFSEDLACIVGGILAATSMASFGAAVLGCFLGIFISDVLLYWLGRILGEGAFKIGFVARAAEGAAYNRMREGFAGNIFRVVVTTRFIPGSRVIAYVTAGVMRIKFPRFAASLAIAAVLWTPILVGVAFFLGQPLIAWWERFGWWVLPLILLGLAGIYLVVNACALSFSYRGRRTLRGRWIRLTRWEYWPALFVYAPVALYGVFLALRYRSALVWAMCNPRMKPLSGLALESKSEILDSLNAESGFVADWICIQPSDTVDLRMLALEAFQAKASIEWPIVLKPDVGQRGEGVAVIRSEAAARNYLATNQEPVIAQRYIEGDEFGVFYYRMPGESKGRLFSITEKVLPVLVGDGARTVERLILDDPRAVAQAAHYLKVNQDRLESVPAVEERIQLVELGTHCRGAIFLDGNRYMSDALAASLDQVVSTYEGFCFGRFDVRVPSGDDLQAGEGFRILELNGVSSESTDIYDPKNSVVKGWSKLCLQWRLAFKIGAANRERGAALPSWSELFAVLRGHRARTPYEAD